jgi:hypothetical protein
LSDGNADGKRKKRGWLWWIGVLFVLGILFDGDNGRRCAVGDEAFLKAIGRAVGQWKVADKAIYLTSLTRMGTGQNGRVSFSAAVAAENGWRGNAMGSVLLRKCRANVDEVQ